MIEITNAIKNLANHISFIGIIISIFSLYVSKIDLIASLQSKDATNAKAPVMKVTRCF
jgi:hypothetical protein